MKLLNLWMFSSTNTKGRSPELELMSVRKGWSLKQNWRWPSSRWRWPGSRRDTSWCRSPSERPPCCSTCHWDWKGEKKFSTFNMLTLDWHLDWNRDKQFWTPSILNINWNALKSNKLLVILYFYSKHCRIGKGSERQKSLRQKSKKERWKSKNLKRMRTSKITLSKRTSKVDFQRSDLFWCHR